MTRKLLAAGLIAFAAAAILPAGEVQGPSSTDEITARTVLAMIPQQHLLKREIDNDLATRGLDEYLRMLDPDKQYFIVADIREFNRGRRDLAEKLKKGDVTLAFDIFRRYQRRVEQVTQIRAELLDAAKFDFTADESYIVNSEAQDYAADVKELGERSRMGVKYELLRIKIDPKAGEFDLKESCRKLRLRYDRNARSIDHTKSDSVMEYFLSSVMRRLDRNTQYFSPTEAKEQRTRISGTLYGIGAMLSTEDEGVGLAEIVPGGPAAQDGRLKVGDRIVSVGQGTDGEMEDIRKLTQVEAIALIRGPTGTTVRLGIISAGAKEERTIALQRGRVMTNEADIKSQVFAAGDGTRERQVGYIHLPSLYSSGRSGLGATEDVRKLLADFTAIRVDVLVMDMRNNTGGGLDQAISLTGLFVAKGPIMQTKNAGGVILQHQNSSETMAWDKPLIVLTNRGTASGAEIFCGAIQDYARGLIVGDESTFGQGTIAQHFAVANEVFKVENPPDLGTLQVTNGQFYRVNGESVQKRGVQPDITLPSPTDAIRYEPRIGAIGFDRTAAVGRTNQGMVTPDEVRVVRSRSEARRRNSADFTRLEKGLEQEQSRRRLLLVPLNEPKFRLAMKALESELPPLAKAGERDYYLGEALTITADYAFALRGRTAAAAAVTVAVAPPIMIDVEPNRPLVIPTPPAPAPAPAPVIDKGALRRAIEVQVLEVERAIERNRDDIAKYDREIAGWDETIRQGADAMQRAESDLGKGLVAAAQGFAIGRKFRLGQDKMTVESSLSSNRDQLTRLKQQLIELRD